MFDLRELDKKARIGEFSLEDMEVMIPELKNLRMGDIYLEVGVDKGKSLSVAQMVAEKGVWIMGVDLKDDPKVSGTTFYQGDSVEVGTHWGITTPISLLFIDGDHTYKGCKADIDVWYPHMKQGGVMMFHDCDESGPGVMWAVSEFVCTHSCSFTLFKYNNKNTSLARVILQ